MRKHDLGKVEANLALQSFAVIDDFVCDQGIMLRFSVQNAA